MHKETKDKHFIQKPTYEGGQKAMKQFIAENLKYPKEALKTKTEGTVYIDYKVDNKGEVVSAKVISGLGHGCDEEALRLVKLLKFNAPRNRKLRITFNKKIQIHFRLPKAKPAPQPQIPQPTEAYNYVITKAKPKPKVEKKQRPQRKYHYTVTVNW